MNGTGVASPKAFDVVALNPATAVVDDRYETELYFMGPGGLGSRSTPAGLTMAYTFDQWQAEVAYRAANGGQSAARPELLLPYFKDPKFGAVFLSQMQQSK